MDETTQLKLFYTYEEYNEAVTQAWREGYDQGKEEGYSMGWDAGVHEH